MPATRTNLAVPEAMSSSNSQNSFSTKWFLLAAAVSFLAGIAKILLAKRLSGKS
jgi:hypothetical protein